MLNGLYLAAAGGQAQSARLDILADNLAKISVTGYRGDYAAVQAAAVRSRGALAAPGGVITRADFSEGQVKETGNPLDVALSGRGLIAVSDGKRTYYTRNGNLEIDRDNDLAVGGLKVQGEGGQGIAVTRDLPIRILEDGVVMQGAETRGKIQVVDFPNAGQALERLNGNFVTTGPGVESVPGTASVQQGMLESSNVDAVRGMVDLMDTTRAFDMNMRMVRYLDYSLQRLISSVGSIPS
jgi:flagellar basal-body rod protein FlgG